MDYMRVMNAVIFGIFGLVIGSFLNVCICRIPQGIPVSKGRSMCPHCGATLRPVDLIPVVSYLLLKGKCRYCNAPISSRYAAIELLTAALFASCPFANINLFDAIVYSLFFAILIAIAFIDYDTHIIYDRFNAAILVLAIVSALIMPVPSIQDRIAGAFIVSAPLLLLAIFTNGFGGGDVKLVAVSGLLLGWKLILLAVFLAIVSAAAFGGARLLTHRATRKTEIAFGPFLCAGMVVSTLVGNQLINWYLSLIFP